MDEVKYSVNNYRYSQDDFKGEIIYGKVYPMNVPSTFHQTILLNIAGLLNEFAKNKNFRIFINPTDVYLHDETVVQPDISIVCDSSKIKEFWIENSPDVIFEIASSQSEFKDKNVKKKLYEENEIKEYIVIYLTDFIVEKFVLENREYLLPKMIKRDEKLKIDSINYQLELNKVFEKRI